MKCTWPMHKFCIGDPTQPIFHWLAMGFAMGVTQILCFALGVTQILAFLDTNMLVSPMQVFLRRSGIIGLTLKFSITYTNKLRKIV